MSDVHGSPIFTPQLEVGMNNYMAVVRKPDWTKAFKIRFEATDNSTALDIMYSKANASKPEDITEYELYQEIDFDKYISVAFKPTSITVNTKQQEPEPVSYKEQAYIPYTSKAA